MDTAVTTSAAASLERAVTFHAAVEHPAIVPLRFAFRTALGVPVLVHPWVDGELLYHAMRTDPHRPWSEPASWQWTSTTAVLLYDFERARVRLLDLDEYRPGPFVTAEQLSGSRRFMAPEEYGVGHVIDIRTTVFTLGRTIRLLLDADDEEMAWRGGAAQLDVARRATHPDPDMRYPTVQARTDAWHCAGP